MSRVACSLIAKNNAEFYIEYGGYRMNHMAHGIIALDKMKGIAKTNTISVSP